jgi:hypothetical protein
MQVNGQLILTCHYLNPGSIKENAINLRTFLLFMVVPTHDKKVCKCQVYRCMHYNVRDCLATKHPWAWIVVCIVPHRPVVSWKTLQREGGRKQGDRKVYSLCIGVRFAVDFVCVQTASPVFSEKHVRPAA